MRLWSLHPQYLDSKGLVALWREALLAKSVLLGNTKGYVNHPQLERFKVQSSPVDCINQYLLFVWEESKKRKYKFNKCKISTFSTKTVIHVGKGQLEYEYQHLLNKLKIRDAVRFETLKDETYFLPHPMFHEIEGSIAPWEIVKGSPKN